MSVCAPLYLLSFFLFFSPAPSPNLLTMIIHHLTCPSCCLLCFFLSSHLHSHRTSVFLCLPAEWAKEKKGVLCYLCFPASYNETLICCVYSSSDLGVRKMPSKCILCPQGFYKLWAQDVQWKLGCSYCIPQKFVKSDKNFLLHWLQNKLDWQERSHLLSTTSTSVPVRSKKNK